jgi:hypothetical protein
VDSFVPRKAVEDVVRRQAENDMSAVRSAAAVDAREHGHRLVAILERHVHHCERDVLHDALRADRLCQVVVLKQELC